jgi:pre-mRNA-processing factor 40
MLLPPSPLQEKSATQTQWKEFTAPDGRKYYYNRLTKESSWTVPEDMKKAREAAGTRHAGQPAC